MSGVHDLAEMMRERGLDPIKLADALGVKRTTVLAWGAFGFRPQAHLIPRLAEVLGVPAADLRWEPTRGVFLDNGSMAGDELLTVVSRHLGLHAQWEKASGERDGWKRSIIRMALIEALSDAIGVELENVVLARQEDEPQAPPVYTFTGTDGKSINITMQQLAANNGQRLFRDKILITWQVVLGTFPSRTWHTLLITIILLGTGAV